MSEIAKYLQILEARQHEPELSVCPCRSHHRQTGVDIGVDDNDIDKNLISEEILESDTILSLVNKFLAFQSQRVKVKGN